MGMVIQIVLHLVVLPLLIFLDLAIWVLTLGPLVTLYKNLVARSVFAKAVGEADINGPGMPPSKVWRSVESVDLGKLVSTPSDDMSTVWDALTSSYAKFADNTCQGTRPLLEWRTDEGFKFPAKVFGETSWRKYKEVQELALAFGAGLRALGAMPQPSDVASADHKGVLIYDDSAAEWMICAQGAMSQDIVVATAYATLGVDAVVKAVKQGGASILVCNRKAVPQVLKLASQMSTLKAIVYTDVLCTVAECEKKITDVPPRGVKLLSYDDVIALGKANPVPVTPPKPESVAVIMYTSGSTGDPKGVMVKQKNMLAMVGAVKISFNGRIDFDSGTETYIAYLPLAHILELTAEFVYYCTGNRIGYADPKSLLGGPERAYPHGGLEEFKPTLMAGVPKVWESIKAGALAKVNKAGAVAKFLIGVAVRMKAFGAKHYRKTPLFNVLLKKFKATTGGNLKACLSGGGAISAEVQEWVRTALDAPLVQGYGLTETTGGATLQMPDDMSIGIAGTPVSSIEICLHSEPDLTDSDGKPYLTTDTTHVDGSACAGRGEVWLRGTNVTVGYYKAPELTAKEFLSNGFFMTGDIGLLTPGGALKIIDRKKNLVKLKGGEYVALEKMNVAYNTSPFVNVDAGGVCCFGDDSMDKPVALAQCKAEELTKAADELGITYSDVSELLPNPKVQEAVLTSFKACAKKAGLTSLEVVAGVYPLIEEWSTANGCLTATSKLVPKSAWKHQKKELDIIKAKGVR
jgi:long-chain acyl-CoA synthetase